MSGARRWPGVVLNLALALGAFSAVAAAIRPRVPWPVEYGLRAKIEYFKQHADRFDTLYIGSSYTHRSYVPELVDRDLAALGIEQTSFNFGVNGMGFYEVNNVLEEILSDPPARLRTVCVETMSTYPDLTFVRDRFETRGVFWHTWTQTWQALAAVWQLKRPWTERLEMEWIHVKMLARKLSNYGQGPRILAALGGTDGIHAYLKPDELEQGRGYQDPEIGHDDIERQAREHFLKHIPDYVREVKEIDAGNARPFAYTPTAAFLVRRQREWLESRGYRVLSVLPAVVGASPEVNSMHREGVIPAMLAFNSPSRYPQLYALAAHFDRGHVNRTGAEAFSHAFAAEFAKFLRAGSAGAGRPAGH